MDKRLITLATGMFALGTDSFVVAGLLPEIARNFSVSVGAAGQMTTVYAITYALLGPALAALAHSVPRKRLLLIGMAIFVLANLATAFAPTFALALFTRAIAGLGAAIFSPTASGAGASLVPPEQRGFALSVVIAGLTTATALGSPAGAIIGGLGDWRWTMIFVAAIGAIAFTGVFALLPQLPLPPAITLRQRLAPLADARIGLTLLTTVLTMSGLFAIYTYFAVVFDRAIGGNTTLLGVLLMVWGLFGTVANLFAGRLVDKLNPRKVISTMLVVLIADIALIPWTGANPWTAALSIAIWGAFGWGFLVPQQYRLVTLAPSIASIVVGLNSSGTYVGVTAAGLIGAAAIGLVGPHGLPLLAAGLVFIALIVAEITSRKIKSGNSQQVAAPVLKTKAA